MPDLPYHYLPELLSSEPQIGSLVYACSNCPRPFSVGVLLGVHGKSHENSLAECEYAYSVRLLVDEQIWIVRPMDIETYQNRDGVPRQFRWSRELSRKLFREMKRKEMK